MLRELSQRPSIFSCLISWEDSDDLPALFSAMFESYPSAKLAELSLTCVSFSEVDVMTFYRCRRGSNICSYGMPRVRGRAW